jgi:hypothetical protein
MNVLLDIHHHDLFRSLYILFRKRLGFNVYVPIGMDWNLKHKFANYPSEGTVQQYLISVEHWMNYAGDVPDVKFLTLAEFKDIKMDIMVASLMENAFVFKEINEIYNKGAKQIIQVGNNFPPHIIDDIGLNLMSSSTVMYEVSKISHKIFYHQEFDLSHFHPIEVTIPKRIFSLQHFFGTGCPPYKTDYALYCELQKSLSDFEFRCYGESCEYGSVVNKPKDVSDVVKDAGFIFHVKPQGDGYGHIYHNAYACGKPVIYKSEYLYWNNIPMTPLQLFTAETSVDLSGVSLEDSTKRIKEISENYPEVTQNVYRRFKEVVDFDQEYEKIKEFIANLV